MIEMDHGKVYLDGRLLEDGVLNVKPTMVFSSGMTIVQNIIYLDGAEVFLDRYSEDKSGNKLIYLRSKK